MPHTLDDKQPPSATNAWAPWGGAAAVAALFIALLHHLVFRGWAHSYDAAIYVRSLWGVANGAWHNPLVDLHVLSIHGNAVLFLLAPFTRIAHPATVLLVAQALSIGATVAMVSCCWRRAALRNGRDGWGVWSSSVLATFLLMVGSPLFVNPFLFDIRPDLIGVPLLTYGVLRAHRTGGFDTLGVAVMCSALLVREEFAMVIVGALLFSPFPRPLRDQWRLRLGGCAIAVGYWCAYWFGFRNWIGDGSYEIAQDVGAAFLDATPLTAAQIVGYKVEIIAAFLLSTGMTVLAGRRWWGVAAPGLALLLVSSRMQDLVLNFHYVAFIAPGIAVAAVDGYDRWLASEHNARTPRLLLTALAATALFVVSNALPGGGRYQLDNFFIGPAANADEARAVRDAHALLARIPPGVGAAVPHELAAPVADREHIVAINALAPELTPDRGPDGVDWIALPGTLWSTKGRMLADLHGFRFVGRVGTRLALMARVEQAPDDAPPSATLDDNPACQSPVGDWPEIGVVLCSARAIDGALHMTLARRAPAAPQLAQSQLALVARDTGTGAQSGAFMLGGLVPLRDLPVGVTGDFVTDALPVARSGAAELAVVALGGGAPVPFIRVGEGPAPSVPVRW